MNLINYWFLEAVHMLYRKKFQINRLLNVAKCVGVTCGFHVTHTCDTKLKDILIFRG